MAKKKAAKKKTAKKKTAKKKAKKQFFLCKYIAKKALGASLRPFLLSERGVEKGQSAASSVYKISSTDMSLPREF